MVLNKKGVYVLDQRRIRQQNRLALQAALIQRSPMPAQTPTSSDSSNSPTGNDQVSMPVHAVQDMLRSLL